MNRMKVLLLYGGESSEHDVSIASARNVYDALDRKKYEIDLCYIDREGGWWLQDEFASEQKEYLVPVLGRAHFLVLSDNRIVRPDVILPILHGKNGEDGSVAALAQLMHIPVVGCDMTSAAICMDKVATKEIVAAHDIPVVPYMVRRKNSISPDYETIRRVLGGIIFVKPSRAGSSIGVNKVTNQEEFDEALEAVYLHDAVALIESAVDGREIEVAVLGVPPFHRASVPGEIIPDRDFYSYDSKYDPESISEIVIPAKLTKEQKAAVQQYAATVFEALGCSGLARVDFFIAKNGDIYLNEVNTLPGFTDISMYPKLWQHDGLSYSRLIDELIADALQ